MILVQFNLYMFTRKFNREESNYKERRGNKENKIRKLVDEL
jgi:hypothetical protein